MFNIICNERNVNWNLPLHIIHYISQSLKNSPYQILTSTCYNWYCKSNIDIMCLILVWKWDPVLPFWKKIFWSVKHIIPMWLAFNLHFKIYLSKSTWPHQDFCRELYISALFVIAKTTWSNPKVQQHMYG